MQKPRCYSELYNDLDREVVNVFRVLQNRVKAKHLEALLRVTPFSREEFDLSYLPAATDVERARLGLGGGDEFGERLEAGGGAGDEREIEKSKTRDRREILYRIERQFLEQRHADRGAVGQHDQRVAVSGRAQRRARRGDAAGAGLILDVKALLELFGEFFGDDARGRIRDAAGRKRHDQADRTIRIIGLGERGKHGADRGYCGQNGKERRQKVRLD